MSRELDRMRKEFNQSLSQIDDVIEKYDALDDHLGQVGAEYGRVAEIYRAPTVIIKDIDRQFEKATKLTGVDIAFLFVAAAVQVLRQCLLRFVPPERLSDQEAAEMVKNGEKEKSNRHHRLYCPSLEEVRTNPVPFDANLGSDGFLAGFGALSHRGATPGHDPVVGLVVGTANIATSTITNWEWQSRHVHSGIYGNLSGQREIIGKNANTPKVFSYAENKLMYQGMEGKRIIGMSLAKEIIHLKSDTYTQDSLALPIITTLDPKVIGDLVKHGFDMATIRKHADDFTTAAQKAGDLANKGLDMANVASYTKQAVKQAGYAILINAFVAVIHGFFYNESMGLSRSMYEVRTRRILSYSNIIASGINIIGTAVTQDLHNLDFGGILVTLHRIASDARYIHEIKRDFLKNELADRIRGSEYDFMEG